MKLRKTNLKEVQIVRYADDFRLFCRDKQTAERMLIATMKWLKERLRLDVSSEKTRIVNTRKKRTKFLGFELRVRKKGWQARMVKQAESYQARSMEKAVNEWKLQHPDGTQKQCAQEIGANICTVNKWWNKPSQKSASKERKTKYIIESHISKDNVKKIKKNLKQRLRKAKYPSGSTEQYEIDRYNSQVLGYHSYFEIATMVSIDLKPVRNTMVMSWHNAMRTPKGSRIARKGELQGVAQRFGGYKDVRFSKNSGKAIYPIGAVKYKIPKCQNRSINMYTPEGRELIHSNLTISTNILKELMCNPVQHRSTEYNDNRLSLYSAQKGKCAVTGIMFETIGDIHCHHKNPRSKGGGDEYQNLVLVLRSVHTLIHAKDPSTIKEYMKILNMDNKSRQKLNKFRKLAGKEPIN